MLVFYGIDLQLKEQSDEYLSGFFVANQRKPYLSFLKSLHNINNYNLFTIIRKLTPIINKGYI